MVSERTLFSHQELLEATRGTSRSAPAPAGAVSSVEVDSRACRGGSLFVALAGERTDGHLYLEQAYGSGCRAFLVRAEFRSRHPEAASRPPFSAPDAFCIEVADTLAALQGLAVYHLRKHPGVHRIGVTGSNGKTTTKELIGSILSRHTATAMNRGNLNSEIGLPLAAFGVRPEHRYAVFEMAMDHEGEMDVLSGIVRPDSALITNIGRAHVGKLGSVEAIAAEKRKIFSRFTGTERAFLPEHDRWFEYLARGVNGRVVPYGIRSTPGFEGIESEGLNGSTLLWNGMRLRLPLAGRHNVMNALAAVAVAVELGVPAEAVREGIERVPRLFGRGELYRGPFTVIQDCYNANPDSMAGALELVRSLSVTGRKILVLGSMRELGAESREAHEELARRAAAAGADEVFFFGAEAKDGYDAFVRDRTTAGSFWTDEIEALTDAVRRTVRENDLVLIKGSRGVALERLTAALVSSAGLKKDDTE